MQTMTYAELAPTLKTGDIIMFEGTQLLDMGIYALELAKKLPPISHIGIVFLFPDGNPSADVLFWQAAPGPEAPGEEGAGEQFGNDYIKNIACDGCQLVSLTTVMTWSAQQAASSPTAFYARRITPALSATQIAAMETFIRQIDGRSFSSPIKGGMLVDYAKGELGDQSPNDTFFCSKLASATFQAIGLLPPTMITNSILPGLFATDNVPLLNGYGFDEGVIIDVSGLA